jgi:predicted nucleic acid-binding protein
LIIIVDVVINTNVVVSALVFGSNPRKVLELIVNTINITISQEILTAVRRIIHSKFPNFSVDLKRLELLLE